MNVSMARNLMELNNVYRNLTTGKRINSASDDASGLAISKKLSAMIDGLEQGNDNSADMQNLTRTAEGGLDSISDSLQRIHELSIQAGSDAYTDTERAFMQDEASQLMDHISSAAQGTEFNKMKLLDGSFANKHTASNPDGSGMKIHLENASLESLGIDGYDLTGNFDISRIEDAMNTVNAARARIGAAQNRLDHTMNANSIAHINQTQARSRIEDADMAQEITKLNTQNVLNQYRTAMQKQAMQQAGSSLNLML